MRLLRDPIRPIRWLFSVKALVGQPLYSSAPWHSSIKTITSSGRTAMALDTHMSPHAPHESHRPALTTGTAW
jgi:hypothetical protein